MLHATGHQEDILYPDISSFFLFTYSSFLKC